MKLNLKGTPKQYQKLLAMRVKRCSTLEAELEKLPIHEQMFIRATVSGITDELSSHAGIHRLWRLQAMEIAIEKTYIGLLIHSITVQKEHAAKAAKKGKK